MSFDFTKPSYVPPSFLDNLGDVPEGDLPDGEYETMLEGWSSGYSKNGNEYILFRFRVVEGKFVGEKIFHRAYGTPAAIRRTMRLCRQLGVNPKNPKDEHVEIRVRVVTKLDGSQWPEIVRFFDVRHIPLMDAPSTDTPGADTTLNEFLV